MMKKTIIQGTLTMLLFFGTWFALTRIDWLNVFEVEKATDRTEQKLGELFWDTFRKSEDENKNPGVINPLDSIVTHICNANNMDRGAIKLHVLNNGEVNAFTLPNGHLVVYSGLIAQADSQEELAGVVCHEIAHSQLDHVMKKLVKEVGLSVLISMTTGGTGAEMIKETARTLSSTAFDRRLEKEADLKAVDYLVKANIDPEPFANFLYKLSDSGQETPKYLTWIGTHPDSKERAEYIIAYRKGKSGDYKAVLSGETWNKLKVLAADLP